MECCGIRGRSLDNWWEDNLSKPASRRSVHGAMMKTRGFLRSGVALSEICLGTASFAAHLKSKRRLSRTLDAAFERGINSVDAALSYGNGAVEFFLGMYVSAARKKNINIISKIPPIKSTRRVLREVYPPGWITRATEATLRLIKRDYVDIQLL